MKTTIDLPEEVLHRAEVAAAQRKTTLTDLVVSGLELVLQSAVLSTDRVEALERLRKGLALTGGPLTRNQVHERGSIH